MLTTLVCFAVKEEAAPFQRMLKPGQPVVTLLTGMGQERARQSLSRHLASSNPGLVISSGFAGGLAPNLTTGSVLFEYAPPEIRARLVAAGAVAGHFHSASSVVVSAAEKLALRTETGADAVEMESSALGDVCRARGVSFAIVRVVLDPASEDLPLDFNRTMRQDGTVNLSALAGELARHPGKIPWLIRLHRQTRAGASRLANVLARVIPG